MDSKDVKRERLRLNLTQAELAGLLAVTGSTVARWERGEVAPPGMLRWAFAGLQQHIGGDPSEDVTERRRVTRRRAQQREIRDLAAKLGFPSAEK